MSEIKIPEALEKMAEDTVGYVTDEIARAQARHIINHPPRMKILLKDFFLAGVRAAMGFQAKEISMLKAELWVCNDSRLRTYDGMSTQAARVPGLEAEIAALKEVIRDLNGIDGEW